MGADWYAPFAVFGYNIRIPDGKSFQKYVSKYISLNYTIEKFGFYPILCEFHSRMEGDDNSDLDDYANFVFGFILGSDMKKNMELEGELKGFLNQSSYLIGIDFDKTPNVFCGINWDCTYRIKDDDESDSDEGEGECDESEDEDKEEEDESDSGEDDDESGEDDDESDEDKSESDEDKSESEDDEGEDEDENNNECVDNENENENNKNEVN